jgi:anti-sigma B factor antagonist
MDRNNIDVSGGLFMEVSIKQYKRCDLVSVSGRIDSATASKLADALDDITDNGRYRIVLDLKEVEFMSSAGLRVLISTQKTCKPRGEVVLAQVPERLYEALELAGFIPLFKFYDEILDAVASF